MRAGASVFVPASAVGFGGVVAKQTTPYPADSVRLCASPEVGTLASGLVSSEDGYRCCVGDEAITRQLRTSDMNGRRGKVINWSQHDDRYAVQLQVVESSD